MLGSLWAAVAKRLCPQELQGASQKNTGRPGNRPASQRHFLPLTAPSFASPGFGKMTRARAAQRVRRFGGKFSGHFRPHLVLFTTGVVAFRTSPLQCLRPLPAWSGSAFGSWFHHCMKCVLKKRPHLMGHLSSTRWWGISESALHWPLSKRVHYQCWK